MRPDHRGTEPSTPFWQLDRPFCTLSWQGEVLGVRLKGHLRHERYSEPAAINPLGLPAGERSYLSIHPYLARPDHRLHTTTSRVTDTPQAPRDDQGDDLGGASVLLDAARWTAHHEHWFGYVYAGIIIARNAGIKVADPSLRAMLVETVADSTGGLDAQESASA